MPDEMKYITEEYMKAHGFEEYGQDKVGDIYGLPFLEGDEHVHFKEKEFDRQMFVVVFCKNYDGSDDGSRIVYVQENAGCGFIEMPFPWTYLCVEYFEAVYYGIRGHKPKFTPLIYKHN